MFCLSHFLLRSLSMVTIESPPALGYHTGYTCGSRPDNVEGWSERTTKRKNGMEWIKFCWLGNVGKIMGNSLSTIIQLSYFPYQVLFSQLLSYFNIFQLSSPWEMLGNSLPPTNCSFSRELWIAYSSEVPPFAGFAWAKQNIYVFLSHVISLS